MVTLSIDVLREEMESGANSDNVFRYQGKEYYFCHSFPDGAYHFGTAYSDGSDDREFPNFDAIMDAHLVGDKPFREMLPEVTWY